ncbi:unnamed protein product [Aspergillus oryzae]|nr:unnamed protein product [Aspergillus oryzae]
MLPFKPPPLPALQTFPERSNSLPSISPISVPSSLSSLPFSHRNHGSISSTTTPVLLAYPLSQRTVQRLEPHMGTNCVGPYLLTSLLLDILVRTSAASDTAPNSVRVIWSSSLLVDTSAPSEGVPPDNLENPSEDAIRDYTISKTGNWFLANRFAKRFNPASVGTSDSSASEKRVVSITANPATVRTGIYDNAPRLAILLTMPFFATVRDGAHTLLWAGCSKDITVRDGGSYVIPVGQWHPNPRGDLLHAMTERNNSLDATNYAKDLEERAEKLTREFQ